MEQGEEEPIDPRVQIELERLNASSDDINKLENKLEQANALFRSTLNDSTASLKLLSGRLGPAVAKARPYYEARAMARHTQLDCHRAAVQFQRASVLHQNARETIQLAEERFLPRRDGSGTDSDSSPPFEFDSAQQEMLNHATMKLLEAEQLKHSSETEHLRRANTFAEAQRKLKQLERSLERHVVRARPYFEQREVVQQELVRQKAAIQQLQRAVGSAKARYSSSLRELESISEQIHQRRRFRDVESSPVRVDLDACELDSVSLATESATSDYQEDFRLSQEQQYWTEMREQIEAMSAGHAVGGRQSAQRPDQLESMPAEKHRAVSEAAGGDWQPATGRCVSPTAAVSRSGSPGTPAFQLDGAVGPLLEAEQLRVDDLQLGEEEREQTKTSAMESKTAKNVDVHGTEIG